jgi:hypothetical protein
LAEDSNVRLQTRSVPSLSHPPKLQVTEYTHVYV